MLRAGSSLIADADIVVPVPLHRRRFFQRRFNQAAELARALSDLSGVAFEPEVVRRRKATRRQVGLGRSEREDNVRGAFYAPAKAGIRLNGRRVLLIDDVFTTGATVSAVARVLLKAGSRSVDVLTFARAVNGDFPRGDRTLI